MVAGYLLDVEGARRYIAEERDQGGRKDRAPRGDQNDKETT